MLDPILVIGKMRENGDLPTDPIVINKSDTDKSYHLVDWSAIELETEDGQPIAKPDKKTAQAIWQQIQADEASKQTEEDAKKAAREVVLAKRADDTQVEDVELKKALQMINGLADMVADLEKRWEKREL